MRSAVSLLALLCLLCACSDERAPLTVTSVRLAPTMPGMNMGAAYLELNNHSAQDIRITRVSSPELRSVEMHESVQENDISRMVKLPEVVVPAGKTLVFEPGGKHLMVRYPEQRTTPVTLNFYADDALLLSVSASFSD